MISSQKKSLIKNSGFSLLETMISIGIMGVIVLAVAAIISGSFANFGKQMQRSNVYNTIFNYQATGVKDFGSCDDVFTTTNNKTLKWDSSSVGVVFNLSQITVNKPLKSIFKLGKNTRDGYTISLMQIAPLIVLETGIKSAGKVYDKYLYQVTILLNLESQKTKTISYSWYGTAFVEPTTKQISKCLEAFDQSTPAVQAQNAQNALAEFCASLGLKYQSGTCSIECPSPGQYFAGIQDNKLICHAMPAY